MALTIEQIKNVGIPLNTNRLNNIKDFSIAPYNASVNLYEAIKVVIQDGGLVSNDLSTTYTTNTATIVSAGTDATINAASLSFAGVMSTTDKQNVLDIATLLGVSLGSTNLGTFTGTTISDNSSVKVALQTLETAVESLSGSGTNLSVTYGTSAVSIQSSTGTDITINAASAGSTAGIMTANDKDNIDNLITLSGLAGNSSNLGSFTGTTIPDDITIKQALQSLETSLESGSSYTTPYELVQSGTYTFGANTLIYAKPGGSNITLDVTTSMVALKPYYLMIRPNSGNTVSITFTGTQSWRNNVIATAETSSSTLTYSTDDVNTSILLFRIGTVVFFIPFNL